MTDYVLYEVLKNSFYTEFLLDIGIDFALDCVKCCGVKVSLAMLDIYARACFVRFITVLFLLFMPLGLSVHFLQRCTTRLSMFLTSRFWVQTRLVSGLCFHFVLICVLVALSMVKNVKYFDIIDGVSISDCYEVLLGVPPPIHHVQMLILMSQCNIM